MWHRFVIELTSKKLVHFYKATYLILKNNIRTRLAQSVSHVWAENSEKFNSIPQRCEGFVWTLKCQNWEVQTYVFTHDITQSNITKCFMMASFFGWIALKWKDFEINMWIHNITDFFKANYWDFAVATVVNPREYNRSKWAQKYREERRKAF